MELLAMLNPQMIQAGLQMQQAMMGMARQQQQQQGAAADNNQPVSDFSFYSLVVQT